MLNPGHKPHSALTHPQPLYPKPLRWGWGIIHSPAHQQAEDEDTHKKEQVVYLKMQWANKHLKRRQKVTKGTRPGPRKCKSKKMLQLSPRQEVMPSPSGQIGKTSRVGFL